MSWHAIQVAKARDLSEADVLRAAEDPVMTLPRGGSMESHQQRHIRPGVVAVVDPVDEVVVTCYPTQGDNTLLQVPTRSKR